MERGKDGRLRRGTSRGRPKRRKTREVRYGEEERGEPEHPEKGAQVHGPHKVKKR